MATSKSIEAILKARDANFTSTFSKAANALRNFSGNTGKAGSGIKSIVAGLGLYKVATAAASVVTNSFGSALRRADTMQNFSRNMTVMLGSSSKAKQMLDELTVATKGTAYGLDAAAKTAQGFSTAGQSMDKATRNTKNFMNAISFYGSGTNEQLSQVTLQMQQMAAKGKANMGDLNGAVQAGIPVYRMYAEVTGQSTQDVMDSLSAGAITSEEFFDGLDKAINQGTKSFPKISDAAKSAGSTWQGSFDNMKAATTRGVLSIVNSVDTLTKSITGTSLKEYVAQIGTTFETVLTSIGNNLQQLAVKVKPYTDAFKTAFDGVGRNVANAIKSVLNALGDLYGGFGKTDSVAKFDLSMQSVAQRINQLSSFIQAHAKQIATLIDTVGKLALAYKGLQFISGLAAPFVEFGAKAAKALEPVSAKLIDLSVSGVASMKSFGSGIASVLESTRIRAMLFSDGFSQALQPKLLGESSSKISMFFKGIVSGSAEAVPSLTKVSNGFKTFGLTVVHPVTSLKTLSASLIATSTAAGGSGTIMSGVGVKVSNAFKSMATGGLSASKALSAGVVSSLSLVGVILAAIVVVIASVAAAWTSNFANIQGFTKSAFNSMKPAIDNIKKSFESMKPALTQVGSAFKVIGAILIGTVVVAIAAVVDAVQVVIATFKSLWDLLKAVGNGFKGVAQAMKGDFKGAGKTFSEAGKNLGQIKKNYTDVWDNSALRGVANSTKELGKATDNTSNSQKNLKAAMDSTKASADQLSGTFSKLNQDTQTAAQKIQEAFGDNEVMQKFNSDTLSLIENGGQQRQAAIDKYNNAIKDSDGKSANERQGIMQKANADFMADFQKSRTDLLTVNNQYSEMLKTNTDKSGQQMNESQRVALVNARNAVVEELATTNQSYVSKLLERVQMGDTVSKEETTQALTNLRESNAQQVEVMNTNNAEIAALKQAQAQSSDEVQKAQFQQEIVNLQNKNQSLTESQTAFGETWLALQASQQQTTAAQLAVALGNEKNLTDQNLQGILLSYQTQGASLTEQMTIMAAMLQSKGVEGATNLVTALQSGDMTAVGASMTASVSAGLATLPPSMFTNGEKGRSDFINALKAGDSTAAGKFLKDGVTNETSKTAAQTGADGKAAADNYNKNVESGKGGAKASGTGLGLETFNGIKSKDGDIANTGKKQGSDYSKGVEQSKGQARSAGSSLANSAKDGASSVGGFKGIVSNMAEGVATGIRSNTDSAVSAMQSLVSKVNAEAKKKAEIKSPSRLFKREVGSFIALGVASGIQDNTSNAVNAMRDLISKASQVAIDGFNVDLGFDGEVTSATSPLNTKLDSLIEATKKKLIIDGSAVVGGHPDTIDKIGYNNYQDKGRLSLF